MKLAQRYANLFEVFGDDGGDAVEEPLVVPVKADPRVARGDTLLDDGDEAKLPSALPGVEDEKWTQFVRGMIVAKPEEVSPSNAVGMFFIMPRRLADLGVVSEPQRQTSPVSGRTVYVATFVAPLTSDKFLKNPDEQYRVFCQSMKDYADKMSRGDIERDGDMSLSGALAVLHRAGPTGLDSWSRGDRFPATEAAYDRVAGIF